MNTLLSKALVLQSITHVIRSKVHTRSSNSFNAYILLIQFIVFSDASSPYTHTSPNLLKIALCPTFVKFRFRVIKTAISSHLFYELYNYFKRELYKEIGFVTQRSK